MVAVFTGLGAGFERSSAAQIGGAGIIGNDAQGRGGDNVSVNGATGNLLISRQDEFLVGQGLDINISRTYNSVGALDENGDHWRQGTDRRVYELTGTANTNGSTVKRVSADGSEITYSYQTINGVAAYWATDGAGAHDKLSYASSKWTWTDGGSQNREIYSAYGANSWRITEASDNDNNKLSYTYSGAKLSHVTTADGGYIEYSWSGNNITKIYTKSSDGTDLTRTYYQYDSQNRLVKVTTDLTAENNSVADGEVYWTAYSYVGNTKQIASITQLDGSRVEFTYAAGKVTSIKQTAAAGDVRETRLSYTSGYTRVYDPSGIQTILYHDGKEQLTTIRRIIAGDDQYTRFSYDASGNVTSVTDAEGGVTSYVYDTRGNVTQVKDGHNVTTYNTYDAKNNLTRVQYLASHASSGNAWQYTRFVYDGENHLRYSISGEGHVTELEYDSYGNVRYEKTYSGQAYAIGSAIPTEAELNSWVAGLSDKTQTNVIYHAYDARGNLTRSINYGAAATSTYGSTAEGFTDLRYTYDSAGRLLSSKTTSDIGTTYSYDGLGRQIRTSDIDGGVTTIAFDDAATRTVITGAGGGVTTSVYNKAGDLISQTQSGSYDVTGTSNYKYDKLGRLRVSTDATGVDNYFLYDDAGNLTATLNDYGHVTEYRYDLNGRLIASVRYTNTDRLSAAEKTTLANPNNTLKITNIRPSDHSSDIWEWTAYDAKGQVTRTALGDGAVTTYTYDAGGRLTATKSYYNKLSSANIAALKAGTTTLETVGLPAVNGKDVTIKTFYNRDGQVIGSLDGDGHLTAITYDEAGRQVASTVYASKPNSSSSVFSVLLAATPKNTATDATIRSIYDGQGHLRYSIDALGYVTEYAYGSSRYAIGLVREIEQHAKPLGELGSYTLASVKAAVAGLGSTADNRSNWAVYNTKQQLVYSIDAEGAVTHFKYDALGNITKTTQFAAERITTGLPTEGQMNSWAASRTSDARITRNYYTASGLLRFTIDAEGYVTRNDYDGSGRQTHSYSYSNAVNATDNWTTTTVYNAAKGDSVLTSITYDLAGRVSTVTRPNGAVTQTAYYANGTIKYVSEAHGSSSEAKTESFYDAVGRVTETRRYVEPDLYGSSFYAYYASSYVSSFYAYDALGNLKTQTQSGGNADTDFVNQTTTFTHDKNGQVLTQTDAEGGITTYSYNAFGQISTATDALGNTTSYFYDRAGRNVAVTNAIGVTSLSTYNAFGDVVAVKQTEDAYAPVTSSLYEQILNVTANERIYDDEAEEELREWGDSQLNAGYYSVDVTAYQGSVNLDDDDYQQSFLEVYNIDTGEVLGGRGISFETVGSKTWTVEFAVGGYANIGFRTSTTYGEQELNVKGLAVYSRYEQVVDVNAYESFSIEESSYSAEKRYVVWDGGQVNAGRHTLEVQAYQESYDRDSDDDDQQQGRVEVYNVDTGQVIASRYVNNEVVGSSSWAIDFELKTATNVAYRVVGEENNEDIDVRGLKLHVNGMTLEAETRQSYEHDKLGRVIKSIDALGHSETYNLNAFGQVESVQNKLGGITYNSYDERGQLIQTHVSASGNAQESITKFEYDSRGNQTKTIEAFGRPEQRTTTYVYDGVDQLIRKESDAVAVYSNGTDRTATTVTPTETYAYDLRGNLIESKDANDARTLYFYDRLDRITHQISAEGTLVRNFYDANGNIAETRVYAHKEALPANALGNPPATSAAEDNAARRTTFAYDDLNRLTDSYVHDVQTAEFGSSLTITALTNDLHTQYIYDNNGNVITTIDPNGNSITSTYDKLDRKINQYDAAGFRTYWAYNADGNVTYEIRLGSNGDAWRTTYYTYDANGNRLTETRGSVLVHDGFGDNKYVSSKISYSYNALGQVERTTQATDDEVVYDYNDYGVINFETRTGYNDFSDKTVKPQVDYHYNALGDVTQTTSHGSTTAEDGVSTYTYGTGGRLESVKDANGFVRTYRYDAVGRVVREEYDRVTIEGTKTEGIGYTFDLEGRVTEQGAVQKSGVYWTRAGLDNIKTVYNAFGDIEHRGINDRYTQIQNDYDNAGRLWRTNSLDGTSQYFLYDANGNQTVAITSDGTDLNVDRNNDGIKNIADVLSLWGVSSDGAGAYKIDRNYVDGVTATITKYDARNLAIEVREPERQLSSTSRSDFITKRSYNSFGEIKSETDARGYTIDYTYNTMGRRIKVESPTVSLTGTDGVKYNDRPTEHYYYDAAGRLVASRDANGNLTKQELLAGTGYDGTEALITKTIAADGGITTNLYDARGFLRKTTDQIGRVTEYGYDKLGNKILVENANGLDDHYSFDGLGQQITHYNSFQGSSTLNTARTLYDAQGRVTKQIAIGGDTTTTSYLWSGGLTASGLNNFGGWTETTTLANGRSSTVQKTVFDQVVQTTDLSGRVTSYSYDGAGRLIQKRTGGIGNDYSYLNTGKFNSSALIDFNGSDWDSKVNYYVYDKSGNITQETFVQEGQYIRDNGYWDDYYDEYDYYDDYYDDEDEEWVSGSQSTQSYSKVIKTATATYDALGRLKTWNDTGGVHGRVYTGHYDRNGNSVYIDYVSIPAASTSNEYDANGNIRRTFASYQQLDSSGNLYATNSVEDHWFAFDNMNRVTTNEGQLINGQVQRGTQGTDIAYDQAGQRVYTLESYNATAQSYSNNGGVLTTIQVEEDYDEYDYYYGYYDDYYYEENVYIKHYTNTRRETYTYDSAGNLDKVYNSTGYWGRVGNTWQTVGPAAQGTLTADHTHDLLGRQTRQIDYTNGVTKAYDLSRAYNAKSQVTYEVATTLRGYKTYKTYTSYNYGSGSDYALGAAVSVYTRNYKANSSYSTESTATTTNSYDWYNGAVQKYTTYKLSTSSYTNRTYFYNDDNGRLESARIYDGRSRTVTFTHDANGQVIRRDESGGKDRTRSPHEVWHRFGGTEFGYVGNNGTVNTSYKDSVTSRTRTQGSYDFRHGSSLSVAEADFNGNYDAINSYSQGSAGGAYTVRAGETLQSIAANTYGDSSLWYKIAQANGLSSGAALIEGQSLRLPSGVTRNTHNASTFKPYDPGALNGDLSPTTIRPEVNTSSSSKKGCGIVGKILLVVVAVAVTVVTAGAAAAALTPGLSLGAGISASVGGTLGAAVGAGGVLGATGTLVAAGAIGGAVGSIASQAVGVVTGIQEKFSWSGVALAAISGGVGGAGVNGFASGLTESAFINGAIGGAASSVISQGIGVATGLQDSFSWAGVAAAGVGAGVGSAVGNRFGTGFGGELARSGASAIANAATRSAIEGSSFGDNIVAAIPDVIGGALGNAAGGALAGAIDRAAADPVAQNQTLNHNDKQKLIQAALDRGVSQADAERIANLPAALLQAGANGSDGLNDRVELRNFLDDYDAKIRAYPGPVSAEHEAFIKATTALLLAGDVYNDVSNPAAIPAGVERLNGNEITKLGLNPERLVNDETGYFSAIYKDTRYGEERIFYVNRGTNSESFDDWVSNGLQGLGKDSPQYVQAISNAEILTQKYSGDITFAGHSLGGGLASAQAIVTGQAGITINAAGLHENTVSKYARDLSQANSLIDAYVVNGEILDKLNGAPRTPNLAGQRHSLEAVDLRVESNSLGYNISGRQHPAASLLPAAAGALAFGPIGGVGGYTGAQTARGMTLHGHQFGVTGLVNDYFNASPSRNIKKLFSVVK